jgi:hypothetical protein
MQESQNLAPDQMIHGYFVGLSQLAANTNAAKLREINQLTNTQVILERVHQQFSRSFLGWVKSNWPGLKTGDARFLQPLWADLGNSEVQFAVYGRDRRVQEWVIALRLSAERTRLWSTNLGQVVTAGAPAAVYGNLGASGWQVRLTNTPGVFRFVNASNWSLVAWTRENPTGLERSLRQLQARGTLRPATTNWLEIEWEGSRLPPELDIARLWGSTPTTSPRGSLALYGSGGYLRTRLNLHYAQDRSWHLNPWMVPTNIIMDPLVSFTALQGFDGWLNSNDKARMLGLNPMPNQLFVWALADTPFQTYTAIPVLQGSNTLVRMAGQLPEFIKACFPPNGVGTVVMHTNNAVIHWRGLPFIIPYLLNEAGPGGDYLTGGFFPTSMTNVAPMPPQLAAQVQNRTNLLFYDWEITQERLTQLQILVPLLCLLGPDPGLPAATPEARAHLERIANWIRAIAPRLGNTITEAVVDSPRELTILRKSHVGLNSWELIALSRWLSRLE